MLLKKYWVALSLSLITHYSFAFSLIATTDLIGRAIIGTSNASSDATGSLADHKIIQAARDDAASFIASQGIVRGVRLEAAFLYLRQHFPAAYAASDQALAEAILAV